MEPLEKKASLGCCRNHLFLPIRVRVRVRVRVRNHLFLPNEATFQLSSE